MLNYFSVDLLLEADDDKIDATPKKKDENDSDYDIVDNEQDQEEDPAIKNVDPDNTDYDIEDIEEDTPLEEDDTTSEEDNPDGEDDTENTDYDIEDSADSEDDDTDEEDTADDQGDGETQENTEEKSLKPENLFGNYELLYKGISNLVSQINQISVRSDSEVDIIDRVVYSLRTLETTVYDYMTKVYESKSYGENLTNLREFQAVLDINIRLIAKINENRKSEDKTKE